MARGGKAALTSRTRQPTTTAPLEQNLTGSLDTTHEDNSSNTPGYLTPDSEYPETSISANSLSLKVNIRPSRLAKELHPLGQLKYGNRKCHV